MEWRDAGGVAYMVPRSKHRATPFNVASRFYDPWTLVNCGKTNRCALHKKTSVSALRGEVIGAVGTDQRGWQAASLREIWGARTLCPASSRVVLSVNSAWLHQTPHLGLQLRVQYKVTLPKRHPSPPSTYPALFLPEDQGTGLNQAQTLVFLFLFSFFSEKRRILGTEKDKALCKEGRPEYWGVSDVG